MAKGMNKEQLRNIIREEALSIISEAQRGTEMHLMLHHFKDGIAELPDRVLSILPNKSKLNQLINQINTGDEDLDPADPILYKFEDEIALGLEAFFKKSGFNVTQDINTMMKLPQPKIFISVEDDNRIDVYGDLIPDDSLHRYKLRKLGFRKTR